MGLVIADMSMSLDGFIADPGDQVGPLFEWYGNGDVEFTFPGNGMRSQLSAVSAEYLERFVPRLGAMVVLPPTPPASAPAGSPPFTFVTGGVAEAIATAQAQAGDAIVAVASAS